MKRFFSCLLVFLCILSLPGCSRLYEKNNSVQFYYLRSPYIFHSPTGSIDSEKRDVTNHDWNYILSLYLLGPSDEKLSSAFPAGTKVEDIVQDERTLAVTLSIPGTISDSMFTAGSGCLALTCSGITPLESVQIQTEKQSVIIRPDMILFQDTPQ